ncbi:MAG: bestrophin family ion channel [Bacteroidia bacterium]|nr:bestrophin family ion channel [Bacteroidia bacterium]
MYTNRIFSIPTTLGFSLIQIIGFALYSALTVSLYKHMGWDWMQIPWLPVSLIGTAVAFYVGFKNNSAYDRTWEARKVWGAIVNNSRSWAMMAKGFVSDEFVPGAVSSEEIHNIQRELVYRHLAWVYALRRQLWASKPWEHNHKINRKFRDMYAAGFANESLESELKKFLSEEEIKHTLARKNPATHLILRQSERLRVLKRNGLMDDFRHIEMEKMLVDLYNQQGACERIKNFPLPRQYATTSSLFVFIFIFFLPFGLMKEFDALGPGMIWLTVPFTTVIGWVYWLMEIVGDYAENPFEGLAFDIPMTALSRTIEIDLREMLGETHLPAPIEPIKDVLL